MAITDNLVESYRFDNATGLLVGSIAGKTLTNTNAVVTDTGKIGSGQSAKFVAASSQILTRTDEAFAPGTGFTFACWAKFATIPSTIYIIAGKDAIGVNKESWLLYLQPNSGTPVFSARLSTDGTPAGDVGLSDISSGSTLHTVVINTWYFVVLKWSVANGATLQVNNDAVATQAQAACAACFNDVSNPFSIGGDVTGGGPYFLDGWVDGANFYNVVKGSTDLTALYNGGAGIDPTGGGGGSTHLPLPSLSPLSPLHGIR